MHMDFHTADDLVDRLVHLDRPCVVLVGSALNYGADGTPGVPSADEMVALVKARFAADPEFLNKFELELDAAENSYQLAMKRLRGRRGQSVVNQVIREAVLQARTVPVTTVPDQAECAALAEDANWSLRPGTVALGELTQLRPAVFSAVLTTNFDTLVSSSIRRAGGRPKEWWADGDGRLIHHPVPGTPIYHLHGIWFADATLHTNGQLLQPRPALVESLRSRIRANTVLVIGYGGWEDSFMEALSTACLAPDDDLEVLWAFYGSEEDVRKNSSHVLERLRTAIGTGRVDLFVGVDAHVVLPTVKDRIETDGGPPPPGGGESGSESELESDCPTPVTTALAQLSYSLVNWPKTLSSGFHFPRPELDELLATVAHQSSSTTLVTGGPGTGKSALLSELSARLQSESFVVALRADELTSNVQTYRRSRQLGRATDQVEEGDFLDDLEAALRSAGQHGASVLVLDQLDSLSSYADRRTETLTLWLRLIRRLKDAPGVHVIASCRRFDFLHDTRFDSLQATVVELGGLAWSDVARALEDAHRSVDTLTNEAQTLLNTPWLVELAARLPEATDLTLMGLLAALWRSRVESGEGGKARSDFLYRLAAELAANESSFTQASNWPDDSREIRDLVEAEILQCVGDRLGFRHQTFYDFALARSFTSGTTATDLASFVAASGGGLFIRPTVARALPYLRDANKNAYYSALEALIEGDQREHIKRLAIDILGGVEEPLPRERELMFRLLAGSRAKVALSAMAGSSGWWSLLRASPELASWLRRPPDDAVHTLKLLEAAAAFDTDGSLTVAVEHWLSDEKYDHLLRHLLYSLKEWTDLAFGTARRVIGRSAWPGVEHMIRRASDSSLERAFRLVEAELWRRLKEAKSSPAREAPNELLGELYLRKPYERLLHDSWYGLSEMAGEQPELFVRILWNWLAAVLRETTVPIEQSQGQYSRDALGALPPEHHQYSVVAAIWECNKMWASADPATYLAHLESVRGEPIEGLQRLLSQGLAEVAIEQPQVAVEYLCGDSRRLALGAYPDEYGDTKSLLFALGRGAKADPSLAAPVRALIASHQRAVIAEDHNDEDRSVLDRWNAETRQELLSFLDAGLAGEQDPPPLKQSGVRAGIVGAPVRADEMRELAEDELMEVLEAHPDGSDPFQVGVEIERSGGVLQLSRELSELASTSPHRATALLAKMQPGRHEQYMGKALSGLARGGLQIGGLWPLVENATLRGFSSAEFRSDVADAAYQIAKRDDGLPETVCDVLTTWLIDSAPWPTTTRERSSRNAPIAFGQGGGLSWGGLAPTLVSALMEGHLSTPPPRLVQFSELVVRIAEAGVTPTIAQLLSFRLLQLHAHSSELATKTWDALISTSAAVREAPWVIRALARTIPWAEPENIAREWIGLYLRDQTPRSMQAAGELLSICEACPRHAWATEEVEKALSIPEAVPTRHGLMWGSSFLWDEPSYRRRAAAHLCLGIQSGMETINRPLEHLLRRHKESLLETPAMLSIVQEITDNPTVLAEVAPTLIEGLRPYVGTHPKLVATVALATTKLPEWQSEGRFGLHRTIDDLLHLAVALHRQPETRAEGLEVFETVLTWDLGPARRLLATLDERPAADPTMS